MSGLHYIITITTNTLKVRKCKLQSAAGASAYGEPANRLVKRGYGTLSRAWAPSRQVTKNVLELKFNLVFPCITV